MGKARALNSVFQRQKICWISDSPTGTVIGTHASFVFDFSLFEASSPDLHQLTLKRDAADRSGILESHTKELLCLFTPQQWSNSVRLVSI